MSDLAFGTRRHGLPGADDAPFGLVAATTRFSVTPAMEAAGQLAVGQADRGAIVAICMVGKHMLDRFRAWRHDGALAQVNRNIAEHEQRAFGREVTARQDGREWLVHRPGNYALERMDSGAFEALRQSIADRGDTLVTITLKGTGARDMTATLCRYVGGILHGDTRDTPAVVKATAQGVELGFYRDGRAILSPGQAPAVTPDDAPASEPEAPGSRMF